jgi:hypothetical protein
VTTEPPKELEKRRWYKRVLEASLRVLPVGIASLMGLLLIATFPWSVFDSSKDKVNVELLRTVSGALILVVFAALTFSSVLEEGSGIFRKLLHWMHALFAEPKTDADLVAHFEKQEKIGAAMAAQVEAMQAALVAARHRTVPPPETEQALVDTLLDRIKSESSRQLFNELREGLVDSDVRASIAESRVRIVERLSLERSRTARRGNFNLFIGLVTTITGITLLVMYSNELTVELKSLIEKLQKNQGVDVWNYLVFFLPRLSLVALIELFAYFFLNLYKLSLIEGKYLVNEITNVELRSLGLGVAVGLGDRNVGTILQSYAHTDRNDATAAAAKGTVTDDRAKILEIVKELVKTSK